MWKHSHRSLISGFLLMLLVANAVFVMHYVRATAVSAGLVQPAVSAGMRFSAEAISLSTRMMGQVASLEGTQTRFLAHAEPFVNAEPGFDAQLLREAAQNKALPVSHAGSTDPVFSTRVGKQKMQMNNFVGLRQQCCQPPDIALATSTRWMLQAVNLEIAVYTSSGGLQKGWPKSLASFFGVTTPKACAKAPFITAPRASYDINERRFWVAAIEDEGLNNRCPFQSLLWVAVSQTSDPNGGWHIYTFDMASGTQNAARFTQFALDQKAIFFSVNMYGNCCLVADPSWISQ